MNIFVFSINLYLFFNCIGMALGEVGLHGEKLVTSASEWSSYIDVDRIKIQRSNLS